MDVIEKWLDTWLKAILKIVQEAGTLEGVVNGFLSQIAPPTNVSEAVVDHDYTLLALKDYAAGARERWTSIILGMRRMEANMVEPVRNLIQNDLKAFKVLLPKMLRMNRVTTHKRIGDSSCPRANPESL